MGPITLNQTSSQWIVVTSLAGDVNGDGLADLIVGAWAAAGEFMQAGQSYVVFGRAPCPWDLDGDGTVGITDFLQLLGAWGACP